MATKRDWDDIASGCAGAICFCGIVAFFVYAFMNPSPTYIPGADEQPWCQQEPKTTKQITATKPTPQDTLVIDSLHNFAIQATQQTH